ncbi:MAG TPA: hypothetical protein VLW47_12850 [Thermodesulfobacteriota bacterium]|nr:hypothetical protein [Thermodesulfobacteriota bacterium]
MLRRDGRHCISIDGQVAGDEGGSEVQARSQKKVWADGNKG